MENILEISKKIKNLKTDNEIYNFLLVILTKSEVETLSKRWQILKMLKEGKTQREIAKELKVSLCKVTRGSKILKQTNSIIANL
ncbi:helix-turn-helix domain-containing protein [bacterium]|nr:helix-turn-helix domain-containing protein [bacterium]